MRSGDNSYEMSNMWQAGGDSQDQVPCGSNQTNCVVHSGGDHHRRGLLWGLVAPRERWLAISDLESEIWNLGSNSPDAPFPNSVKDLFVQNFSGLFQRQDDLSAMVRFV